MILITGGACQGKLDYAFALLGTEPDRSAYADGREDSYETAFNRSVLYGLHEYVKRILKDNRSVRSWLTELSEKNPDALVVTNELGCGIVPADPFDRAYREAAGRAAVSLAAKSEEVHRVICGIGTRIK